MKSQFISMMIWLTLMVGIQPAMSQVTNLGIAPAGKQSIIYWPISTTNYVLQTTTNLSNPKWLAASNAINVNAVVVTNSAPSGYFRLQPPTNTIADRAFIPAGAFKMGDYSNCNQSGDQNPVTATISSFYIDVNLVSYSQWLGIYNWATNRGYGFVVNGAFAKATNNPVTGVDWYDCLKWCNARSQQAGLTPVYYTDAGLTHVYTNGEVTPYVNWTNSGYRLPTEAEWEKAARGGLGGQRFPWGDFISESQANYVGGTANYNYDLGPNGYNSIGVIGGTPYTSPVGSFAPNSYGLYDMAGNVNEWCWDGYYYILQGGTDPRGYSVSSSRVLRGGSYDQDASQACCANRQPNNPVCSACSTGLRCVTSN
jgi:formylglycine-generating enzyme required for sulfatase activity